MSAVLAPKEKPALAVTAAEGAFERMGRDNVQILFMYAA
jgi:hypothetical protein